MPSQNDLGNAMTKPNGPRPTPDAPPPVSTTDTPESEIVVEPTSTCVDLDCLRPIAAWVSLSTTISDIGSAPLPVGLFRGGTHVKIVEGRQD
ncbi:hypothetical protein C8Q70DRAFT_527596 [Cubamyces menziesii]|nr:hypothetical protein C8Q70DRAFT_527596 [Cubamyces menziesii]